MSHIKGSKPFVIGEEGISSRQKFELWRTRLLANAKLDKDYVPYLVVGYKWMSKESCSNRGLVKPEQGTISVHLDNFIEYIASYCPIQLYFDIINCSTSVEWIINEVRALYQIQVDDVNLFDWEHIKMTEQEVKLPELLYRRIRSFIQENLLKKGSTVNFKGKDTYGR